MNSGKRKKTGLLICLLSLLIGAVIAWFATADLRTYRQGVELADQGHYEEAAVLFKALDDYRDSAALLQQINYAIADGLLEEGAYAEAAETFAALGDYQDSTEKMKESYYHLATAQRVSEDYELAYENYTLAQDFRDAATQAQRMLYTLGHNAFLESDYTTSEAWFSQLDGAPEDYGYPHFMTLAESTEYLRQQLDTLEYQISFHLAQEPTEEEWAALRNYLPYHAGSISYYDVDQMVIITVTEYYPSDRILDAWENGETNALTEEEQQVLDLALELVEQAKAETTNDYELEFWLHDWLCQQVVYESPNMDVGVRDYVQLRQLSCIGAMLYGNANCQGYTDSFYLLSNLAGLEVTRLFGNTGAGHTWNMIKLEDSWYIVDVTFDDLSDTEYDGWTYTYCNTALDPDTYEIYGGADALPGMATETDIQKTWFGQTGTCFSGLSDAAAYLVSQSGDQNKNWCYAMVEDADFTYEDLKKALYAELKAQKIHNAGWVSLLENYLGDTFISICWDKG